MPKIKLQTIKNTNPGNFTLIGADEFYQLLVQLPAKVQAKILRGAPNAAAKGLAKEIKDNAPKRSGTLKKAIKHRRHEPRDDSGRRIPGAVVYVEHGGRARYDAFYWYMVERGTIDQSAQPFIRPALDSGGPRASHEMGQYIRKRFDKEVAKAAK